MLRKSCLAIAVLATLGGSASVAQAQGGPGGGRMMRTAVSLLLDSKDSLQLSADQVARLDSLGKATQARNAPAMEKMRAARESGAGMEAMREIMMEMRKNDEQSFEAALAILTDAQRLKAKELVEKARQGMRRPQ